MKKKVKIFDVTTSEQVLTIDNELPVNFFTAWSNSPIVICPKPVFDSLTVFSSAKKAEILVAQFTINDGIGSGYSTTGGVVTSIVSNIRELQLSGYKQFVIFGNAACKLVVEETQLSDEQIAAQNLNGWAFSQQQLQAWIANQ